jgi:NTE family protein
VQSVEGPTGTELVMAAADTAVAASVNAGFTAFERTMKDWQAELIRWRCGLSAEQRRRFHAPANWNCRDVRFYVNRLGFDQLGPERAKKLNAVDTRFTLPTAEVDTMIEAGHDVLRSSRMFQDFLRSVGGRSAPRPEPTKPEATPVADLPASASAMASVR